METDPHNLRRFVDAQDPVFDAVLRELAAGQKRTHWMWFVFPQIQGLGHSPTAREFAIVSANEAKAYADHAVLGPRLIQCAELVIQANTRRIDEVFGYPDDLKFRSSMTLFDACTAGMDVFQQALDKYFQGQPDERTLAILKGL